MDLKVIDFQVWQDFMPSIGAGGPPLHAFVTIEVQGPVNLLPSNSGGTITIARPGGQVITDGTLKINRQEDDLGLLQPGAQQYTFIMDPHPIALELTENEPVTGTARLRLVDAEVTLQLPETRVAFTH